MPSRKVPGLDRQLVGHLATNNKARSDCAWRFHTPKPKPAMYRRCRQKILSRLEKREGTLESANHLFVFALTLAGESTREEQAEFTANN